MSIQSEIDRIISIKNELRTALQDKGAALTDGSVLADFVGAVNSLEVGGGSVELPTVSVTADKLLNGVTAIDSNGKVVTGTIDTVALSRSEDVVSIGKGYTTGDSITIPSAVIFSNRIDIESGGTTSTSAKIRVNIGVDDEQGGYVPNDWTFAKDVTINAAPAKEWTPGTSNQTLSKHRWLNGDQVIKGDSNLKAANIKSGVSIFGVTGTYEASVTVPDETTAVIGYNYLGVSGNADGTTATVLCAVAVEEAGYVTTDWAPEWSAEVSAVPYTEYTPSANDQFIAGEQWLNGNQVIKGDSNLKAENIKKGVTLFGVVGTLEESTNTGTSNISFGVVDKDGKFQPLNGENTPPTAVGNPVTGEFYTFDTDRAPAAGTGGGSFIKVTNFIAPHEAYTATTAINVTGFGEAYNEMEGSTEDFSKYNGVYAVTAETANETDITKQVFKHPTEEMYIFFGHETEYGEGDCWFFDNPVAEYPSAYGALAFKSGKELPNGTANWNKVYYDLPALTTTHVTADIPEQELVLSGVAAKFDPSRRKFVVVSNSETTLTSYTIAPEKGNIYACSGSDIYGHPVALNAVAAIPSNFTADDSIPGYVIDFSAADGEYDEAYMIFNMNFTEGDYAWYDSSISESNPGWVSIEVPEAFAPSRIFIMNEVYSPQNLKNAQFQGYNNDGTWDTLVTITDSPNKTGLQQTFDIDTDKAYKKFRLLITAAYNSGVSIQAFTIYRKEYDEK